MDREALEALSHAELVTLALRLAGALVQQAAEYDARIAELTAYTTKLEKRVAELEAKLDTPPKTPNNSWMPPKPNLRERGRKRRKGRPGVTRTLAENPDRVVEALAEQCPHCTGALTEADQNDVHAYDHIDMPPIRPDVTRINRHRGVCPHCTRRFSAPVPEQSHRI